MSDSVVVGFAIAVFLFWSMGAYNRLMRLRSQGIAAFAALEGLFKQYLPMVKKKLPRCRGCLCRERCKPRG